MKLLSSCVLAVAALAVASLSQPTLSAETCGSGACLSNYDPVCGSDGKTYSNACELSRAKCTNSTLTQKSTGECAGSSTGSSSTGSAATCAQEFACMAVYDPVCGSDGKTYSNACELKRATCANPAVTLKSTGECSGSGSSSTGSSSGSGATVCKIKGCTKEYKPVCGSDNKSYANKCLFTNAQCETPTLTIKTEVACEGDDTDGSSSVGGDACVTMCTEEHKPVCGSNNLTYENACLLKNAQCANATITKTADSACPTAATPATGSAAESTAVAGIQVAALAVLSAVASLML